MWGPGLVPLLLFWPPLYGWSSSFLSGCSFCLVCFHFLSFFGLLLAVVGFPCSSTFCICLSRFPCRLLRGFPLFQVFLLDFVGFCFCIGLFQLFEFFQLFYTFPCNFLFKGLFLYSSLSIQFCLGSIWSAKELLSVVLLRSFSASFSICLFFVLHCVFVVSHCLDRLRGGLVFVLCFGFHLRVLCPCGGFLVH